ncbi:hypothetical protein HID58_080629 [Brassica napus]|uniref:Uncharacterized protein n=1 Tax=Brassica napus TaxID=3708 RepID=A0ABQ7Y5F8_BRANA|nr:hypothetical protein HID58_080629 [Brassica napus]
MAFLVTSVIFAVVGIIASIFTRICFNQGPSTNLLHFTLVITATVGNRLHCADEASHCPNPKRGGVDTHLCSNKNLHLLKLE